MQVKSYHKLKSNYNYSMENTTASKVLIDFDEPVSFNTINDCIKAIESNIICSNAIISSSHFEDTDRSTDFKIRSHYGSKLNTELQFVTVGFRGDCNSHIICGYGY
jgi:hypothetical protein